MASPILLARRTELALSRQDPLMTTSRQLDLVLDDARLRGMTQEERRAAMRSLVHLLLEASGLATQEAGNDVD